MKKYTLLTAVFLILMGLAGSEVLAQRFQLNAEDGYRWRFDARVQFDGGYYFDDKNTLNPNIFQRRTTLRYTGDLGRQWRARLDLDLAGIPEMEMRDIWIRYRVPESNLFFKVGYFKPLLHTQNTVGHARPRFDFMERSVANVFTRSRTLGMSVQYYQDQYSLNLGFFTQDLDDGREMGANTVGRQVTFRGSVAPILQDDRWVHLAIGADYRDPGTTNDAPSLVRFRERAETRAGAGRFYNTDRIAGVDNHVILNFDVQAVFNTIWLGGEYTTLSLNRIDGFEDASFSAGYAFISWAVTGESRGYDSDDGEPARLASPIRNWGAISLGLRYSFIDLNDADIFGGSGSHLTFGVTYYPHRNTWLQLNIGHADMDEYADGAGSYIGDDSFQFVQMRVGAWF